MRTIVKGKEHLMKHKAFLARLNKKKLIEKQRKQEEMEEMKKRDTKIKEQSSKQREHLTKWREEMKAIENVFEEKKKEEYGFFRANL